MNKDLFYKKVQPFSMTSKERIYELYESLEYVRLNKIEGDFVECGVWKGGNILGVMEYFNYHNITDKKIWLFDTFNGMTTPTEVDVDLDGNKASDILSHVLCLSPLEEVKQTLSLSSFDDSKLRFVIGDVCETLNIESNIPSQISILRLDTDFYDSTKKELEVLYPKLIKNGILIVDDYGHWRGSQLAVDEYFENSGLEIKKIDYTGIKLTKI